MDKLTSLDFGKALAFLKEGEKVARNGWNGKGMYITYMPGYPDGIEVNENTQKAHNLPTGAVLIFEPYLQMRTASGSIAMWLASQADLLSRDWEVV